jgi:hypothetical protein
MHKFVYIDDCVYYFSDPPPPQEKEIELDPIDTTSFLDIKLPAPPSKWDIFKIHLKGTIDRASFVVRHNYVLIIAFLLLILLPASIKFGKRLLMSGNEQ